MWILFEGGFVSIVQHREEPDMLCVRGRVKADVSTFCAAAGSELPVLMTPDGDYRYRVVLSRAEVQRALDTLVTELDYDNFKSRIAEIHGHERAHIYAEVWSDLHKLQR
jgi:hypothetical protein